MHFGNNSRWWEIEKRELKKNSVFTQAESSRIALLVRNLSGKILYLCILIPQSEYIKIQMYVTRKLFFGSVILTTR